MSGKSIETLEVCGRIWSNFTTPDGRKGPEQRRHYTPTCMVFFYIDGNEATREEARGCTTYEEALEYVKERFIPIAWEKLNGFAIVWW